MEGNNKKEKIYSYSKLSSFEQCQLKFKFRYIDKIIPKIEKSIEALLGSAVHHASEWLYTKIKQYQIPTIDEVIIEYAKKWKEDFKENMVIVDTNLVSKDYFNKGIEFLVTYYMQNKPFNDNTLEVEQKIIIELDEPGEYKIQGFIDRVAYNLKTKEYEVHDYKTANTIPTKETLEKDRQLALYSIAVKNKYGQNKRVNLIWHFLAHNKKVEIKKTDEELEKLKIEIIDLINKIESTKEFPYNKSKLCSWCEYKSICPAWGNSPPSKEKKEDLKDNLDKYPTLKKYIKE
jgi:putative RecB family exonuclease